MPVPVLPFHSVAHLLCYCGDTKFMLSEMADVGFWTVHSLEVKQDKCVRLL